MAMVDSSVASTIAYIGAFVGLLGGGIALYNARKAVLWKRAELASSYLKEFNSNQELVFACRALDWTGGKLVVPDLLAPLLNNSSRVIDHSSILLKSSLQSSLTMSQLEADPRIQIYRTAIDGLLSWFSLVDSALQQDLFAAEDIRSVGWWVQHINNLQYLEDFIDSYGYREATNILRFAFGKSYKNYRHYLLQK